MVHRTAIITKNETKLIKIYKQAVQKCQDYFEINEVEYHILYYHL
jgi:hypothetical protein